MLNRKTGRQAGAKFGFTIAEILITLSIIGIVASLTIPGLLQNYEKQVFATRLKKAYAMWSQALPSLARDSGCVGDLKCTGLFTTIDSTDFGNEIVKYFKTAKICGTSLSSDCMPLTVSTRIDGKAPLENYFSPPVYFSFQTIDGFSFAFNSNQDCHSSLADQDIHYICGYLAVDINGTKRPNIFGKDLFWFYVMNSPALYPYGGDLDKTNPWQESCIIYNKNIRNTEFCAGRVMEEGWVINYY